jgi:uncharacterized protein YjbI with pentapeptide repeats
MIEKFKDIIKNTKKKAFIKRKEQKQKGERFSYPWELVISHMEFSNEVIRDQEVAGFYSFVFSRSTFININFVKVDLLEDYNFYSNFINCKFKKLAFNFVDFIKCNLRSGYFINFACIETTFNSNDLDNILLSSSKI